MFVPAMIAPELLRPSARLVCPSLRERIAINARIKSLPVQTATSAATLEKQVPVVIDAKKATPGVTASFVQMFDTQATIATNVRAVLQAYLVINALRASRVKTAMYALIRGTPESFAIGVLLSLPDLTARSAHLLVLRVHCVIPAPKDTRANIVKFALTNASRGTTAMNARMLVTRDLSVNNADMDGGRSPLIMLRQIGITIQWLC